jgi:predicted RNA binding protein YcfA (HicA-like mRNA interferase family)
MMLSTIADTLEKNYGWNAGNFVMQANAATAAEGRVTSVKALEDAPISKLQRSELSAQAKEFLNCGMDAGAQPKPMKWATFIKVMGELGFEHHDTAGSSVRFDPPNPSDNPISIHKPHPDSTLTPFMLVKIAMRLKRFYGWTEESFATEANAAVLAAGSAINLEVREEMFASSDAFQQFVVQWLTVGAEFNAASKGNVSHVPLKWETFVGLMTGMGFEVDQTHSASVRFTPSNPEDHAITLHRPYPDDFLTPMMLIKIGKRLQRYYNWDEEDFATKAKTAAATDLESCE